MTVPQVLHPFAAPTRQAGDFLEIVRGEGCRLWDSDGHVYLDGTASLWYCAVGHGRREIANAVAAQMEQVAAYHTFASFTNGPEQRLAELLMELEPIPDARVLFTLTGSEAVDSALKLARAGHRAAGDAGRTVFLSRHYAYHGVMLGGTSIDFDSGQSRGTAFGKENVVAERAMVSGDLRTLSKEQLDEARQAMQAVVADALPHTEATLTFTDGYPSLAPTEGNARLLAVYDQVSQDLGSGHVAAVSPDRAGAADVSFVAGEVPSIIDGIGLMGHDDHTAGETADLATLPSQTKRAAITLYRLAQQKPPRTAAHDEPARERSGAEGPRQ